MKKRYVRPTMVGERFVANEYVAACGDSRKVYKFECNAPGGKLFYYPKSDGTIDGIYTGDESAVEITDFFTTYSPCGEKHDADATDDFYDGYVMRGEKKSNVIVWRGSSGRDGHATANLNMETWETAKS